MVLVVNLIMEPAHPIHIHHGQLKKNSHLLYMVVPIVVFGIVMISLMMLYGITKEGVANLKSETSVSVLGENNE